jgi:1-acyl-sn-glycerol-3-phosphate acyltransferase
MKFLKAIYSIYVILTFFVIIILAMPIVFIIALLAKKVQDKVMHQLVSIMSKTWFGLIGIKSKFYNRQLLASTNGAIIIPNHASYLDAPVLYRSINELFKTLGKAEMLKVPLFKYIYKITCIPVDRSSIISKAKSFINMQTELTKGVDIVIFPEGTFTKDNSSLLPFKDGAFKLALQANRSLLPILMLDTAKRMEYNNVLGFTPGINRVVYLPYVNTTNLVKEDDKILKAYCYNYMNSVWQFLKTNPPTDAFAFAENWLKNNPIK